MILLALISLNLHNRGQIYPTQLFVYIFVLFLIGKYVTENASRARAELGLVLNTCHDINFFKVNGNLSFFRLSKGI